MHAWACTRIFSRARMYSSNSVCMTKSSFIRSTAKFVKAMHMRVFEIVLRNVDNYWTQ